MVGWVIFRPPPEILPTKKNATPQVTSIAGLSVDPAALDLGEVWEAEGYTCKVPITNKTNAPIEITAFAVSCGCCMSIEPRQLTISAALAACYCFRPRKPRPHPFGSGRTETA